MHLKVYPWEIAMSIIRSISSRSVLKRMVISSSSEEEEVCIFSSRKLCISYGVPIDSSITSVGNNSNIPKGAMQVPRVRVEMESSLLDIIDLIPGGKSGDLLLGNKNPK
ncbi:hypothetical protein PanWU01x14_334570 [Parasponia andersonii]|uniref:Uncharacterized protein n=1 Tax=Parasponia andersonii TaxID=3476 RepID=A0A2P5AGK3_PARAD|nr:hypothetical protein PanWU01x14_334570 [Parasponia andersonii]